MNKRAIGIGIGIGIVAGLFVHGVANAGKPEDAFKGQIIITKKRLPQNFSSQGAFVSALRSGRIDKIWPVEEKGDEHAVWKLEYIAFFAQPLNDNEIQIKFYDITDGGKKYIAGDPQYTRERGSRIFGSSIELAKPEFQHNKHYLMTVESRGQVVAKTQFWLRGKGPQYSGKVEFSEEEAKKKN